MASKADRRVGRNNGALIYHRDKVRKVIMSLPPGCTLLHGHTHTPLHQIVAGNRRWIDCGSAVDGGVWFAVQTLDDAWHLLRWER